jgi:hypothetical protein
MFIFLPMFLAGLGCGFLLRDWMKQSSYAQTWRLRQSAESHHPQDYRHLAQPQQQPVEVRRDPITTNPPPPELTQPTITKQEQPFPQVAKNNAMPMSKELRALYDLLAEKVIARPQKR